MEAVGKLTKVQTELLRRAAENGRIAPYWSEWQSIYRLQAKGLMKMEATGNTYVITELGRQEVAK